MWKNIRKIIVIPLKRCQVVKNIEMNYRNVASKGWKPNNIHIRRPIYKSRHYGLAQIYRNNRMGYPSVYRGRNSARAGLSGRRMTRNVPGGVYRIFLQTTILTKQSGQLTPLTWTLWKTCREVSCRMFPEKYGLIKTFYGM